MKTKTLSLSILLVAVILLTACGPSAEQIATMTASAWTPTPRPTATPTITPSPTPVPYDLTVKVTDADGNPIAGASVVFPESGNGDPVAADDAGQAAWSNLASPGGSLTVTAQGYLKGEQSLILERGPNEVVVKLERDPFGILPSEACASGEQLVYLEDFQDGEAQGWHGDENDQPVSRYVGSASDAEANSVWTIDATKITEYGDNAWLGASYDNGTAGYFGDAVWRMRFMVSRSTAPTFGWHSAGPSEFGGQEVTGTGYAFHFWGAPYNQIHLNRTIFDVSGVLSDKDVVTGTFTQAPMQWHQMELSSYQGHLQMWIDGKLEAEYTDSEPLPAGGIGIWIGPFTDKSITVLYFDNIAVCGLSAPFTSMFTPAVAP